MTSNDSIIVLLSVYIVLLCFKTDGHRKQISKLEDRLNNIIKEKTQ